MTFDPSMLEIWSVLLVSAAGQCCCSVLLFGAAVLRVSRSALSLHETSMLIDERVTSAADT